MQTRFEQEYVRCVRNEKECVCSAPNCSCNILISGKIIKEMPGFVGRGTPCSSAFESSGDDAQSAATFLVLVINSFFVINNRKTHINKVMNIDIFFVQYRTYSKQIAILKY